MRVIRERNAEEALATVLIALQNEGVTEQSRNGPVLVLPEPLSVVYEKPRERVIFDETRDCNPFLHFFESLWMLDGRNDVEFMAQFSKNMENFSDDEKVFNGAYGHRWRKWFGRDQLAEVIELLKRDKTTRRAVLGMWDPREDLFNQSSSDLPCNTQVMFRVSDRNLNMTVINRSNDIIWGMLGANVVHFSYLQEYVACAAGLQIGRYTQVSNNAHIYPALPVAARMLASAGAGGISQYGKVQPAPMLRVGVEETWEFHGDLERFFLDPLAKEWSPRTLFFQSVVLPMWEIWANRRAPEASSIEYPLRRMADCDWKQAAIEWVNRRRKKGNLPIVSNPFAR